MSETAHHIGAIRRAVGRKNLEFVRQYFATHLCATNIECAKALGLSTVTVSTHVQTLRAEWFDADQGTENS